MRALSTSLQNLALLLLGLAVKLRGPGWQPVMLATTAVRRLRLSSSWELQGPYTPSNNTTHICIVVYSHDDSGRTLLLQLLPP